MTIDLETSHQVLFASDRLVSFQVQSVLFFGLSWSDTGVLEYDMQVSVSQQDSNSRGRSGSDYDKM